MIARFSIAVLLLQCLGRQVQCLINEFRETYVVKNDIVVILTCLFLI